MPPPSLVENETPKWVIQYTFSVRIIIPKELSLCYFGSVRIIITRLLTWFAGGATACLLGLQMVRPPAYSVTVCVHTG